MFIFLILQNNLSRLKVGLSVPFHDGAVYNARFPMILEIVVKERDDGSIPNERLEAVQAKPVQIVVHFDYLPYLSIRQPLDLLY